MKLNGENWNSYYTDNIMMWLSVDPMSDERPWISPYNYCQWNPIGRVDTWGMLDDEWSIDKATGKITWLNDNKHYDANGNEVDKLFNSRGESIDVTKGTLNREQEITCTDGRKGYFYNFASNKEAEDFYYFVAESSSPEWAFADLGPNKSSYVGTNRDEGSTSMLRTYEHYFGSEIIRDSHSHSGAGGAPSYGIKIPGIKGTVGDLETAHKSPYNFQREVYDVPRRTIYGYNNKTEIPVRNQTPKWDYVRRRY